MATQSKPANNEYKFHIENTLRPKDYNDIARQLRRGHGPVVILDTNLVAGVGPGDAPLAHIGLSYNPKNPMSHQDRAAPLTSNISSTSAQIVFNYAPMNVWDLTERLRERSDISEEYEHIPFSGRVIFMHKPTGMIYFVDRIYNFNYEPTPALGIGTVTKFQRSSPEILSTNTKNILGITEKLVQELYLYAGSSADLNASTLKPPSIQPQID